MINMLFLKINDCFFSARNSLQVNVWLILNINNICSQFQYANWRCTKYLRVCCRLSQFWQTSLRTQITSGKLRPLAKKMSKLFSWSWLSFRTAQKLLNFLCSLLTNTSLVAEGIWLVTSNYTLVVNNCNVLFNLHLVSQLWNLIEFCLTCIFWLG